MSTVAVPLAQGWPRVARPAVAGGVFALAGALRLYGGARTPLDPFYDAAVRSMGTSWHAFWVGAFEPSGHVAIDKPPLDLWLQVASTKLLGFGPVGLLVPAALGGTLAVVALFDLLKTLCGWTVAVVGALALAVLPVAVLSARSDTMDAAMAALVVAAWAVAARGLARGGVTHAVAAGALVGLAFEVKLFEALIGALPLLALWLLAATGSRRRRVLGAAAALAACAGVGLAWLALAPHAWAIGSSHGSPWQAAFVYDGWDRLAGAHHAVSATGAAHVPARPGPLRLFSARDGLAGRLGIELAAAWVAVAAAAVATRGGPWLPGWVRGRRALPGGTSGSPALAGTTRGRPALAVAARGRPARPASTPARPALAGTTRGRSELAGSTRAGAAWRRPEVALVAWLALGTVLFSLQGDLRPRYLEAFTPAVAACLALGARRVPWLVGAALLASLAVSVGVVRAHAEDSGSPGSLPALRVERVSAYLRAHQDRAAYEFASVAPSPAAPLIVRDGRPALILTAAGHDIVAPARLSRLVAGGAVHAALVPRRCTADVCAWVRIHGTDVSRAAGEPHAGALYALGRS